MTEFQRQFTIALLTHFRTILNNESLIEKAVLNFAQGSEDSRYSMKSAFSEAWTPDEIKKVSAAFAQAYIVTMEKLGTQYDAFDHQSQIHLCNQYKEDIQKVLLPQLINTVTEENRLTQLSCVADDKVNAIKLTDNGYLNNPYLFFAAGAVGTVIAAAIIKNMLNPS